jgi:hypothetical protein
MTYELIMLGSALRGGEETDAAGWEVKDNEGITIAPLTTAGCWLVFLRCYENGPNKRTLPAPAHLPALTAHSLHRT